MAALRIVNLHIRTPDLRKTLLINLIKAPYRGYWGMPAGKIEKRESPEEAAVRELFEETGIEANLTPCSGFCSESIYEKSRKIFDFDIYFFNFTTDKDVSGHNSKEGELRWFYGTQLMGSRIIPSDWRMMRAFEREYKRMRSSVVKEGDVYTQSTFGEIGEWDDWEMKRMGRKNEH
jgi:8-oxo-dGTP pyrophosphatase MutT (NUDIX family)